MVYQRVQRASAWDRQNDPLTEQQQKIQSKSASASGLSEKDGIDSLPAVPANWMSLDPVMRRIQAKAAAMQKAASQEDELHKTGDLPAVDTDAVQMKCSQCETKEKVQLHAGEKTQLSGDNLHEQVQLHANGLSRAKSIQQIAAEGFSGSATTLPHLNQIQQSFGVNLSHVQAYIGGDAAAACQQMGADAYASGNQIAFKEAPSVELAAHEAAHIVQQQSGKVQLAGGVGKVGDKYEQHADDVAARVGAGQSAQDLLVEYGNDSMPQTVQAKASEVVLPEDIKHEAIEETSLQENVTPHQQKQEKEQILQKSPQKNNRNSTGIEPGFVSEPQKYLNNLSTRIELLEQEVRKHPYIKFDTEARKRLTELLGDLSNKLTSIDLPFGYKLPGIDREKALLVFEPTVEKDETVRPVIILALLAALASVVSVISIVFRLALPIAITLALYGIYLLIKNLIKIIEDAVKKMVQEGQVQPLPAPEAHPTTPHNSSKRNTLPSKKPENNRNKIPHTNDLPFPWLIKDGQTTPDGVKYHPGRIELRYKPVAFGGISTTAQHGFVVVTSPFVTTRSGALLGNFYETHYRGGPSGPRVDSSNPKILDWGYITTVSSPYNDSVKDWTVNPTGVLPVRTDLTNEQCTAFRAMFAATMVNIESARIAYGLPSPRGGCGGKANSNSTAHQAIRDAGLGNPSPPVFAPCWEINPFEAQHYTGNMATGDETIIDMNKPTIKHA
ncbi:DUF4157 domain-containing protein [Tolypothrix bouteillei VB521301_2]|uniref:eCIS core domain-containing protein n=1 Tax=Tolypothrix bouteillei VB521301 TaxID=1479485 RepID=A0A0C1NBI9_9CYAN